MQFSLRALFLVVSLSAVFCGILFALPVALSLIVLTLLSFLLPPLVVGGIVYGRDGVRAFWIGCAVSGFVSTFVASIWRFVVCIEMIEGNPWFLPVNEEVRWIVAILASFHLLIFFSGGAIVVVMRRLCCDKKNGKESGDDRGKARDALPLSSSI